MKFDIRDIRKLFPTVKITFTNILIGSSVGLAIYLGTLQRHFFSKRYFIYLLLISLAASILVAWLRQRVLANKYLSLKKNMRVLIWIFTAILSLILLVNTEIQPLYYALPDTSLQISIPIGAVPEDQESVRLLWVETGQGYVYYTNMQYVGEWERVGKNILFAPDQEVIITWQGKVGPNPEIAFRMTPYDQPVFVSWNGVEQEYNLHNPKEPNILIQSELKIPLI